MHTHICTQAKEWGLYRIDVFVTSSYKSPKGGLGEFRNHHHVMGLVGCFGLGFFAGHGGSRIQAFGGGN